MKKSYYIIGIIVILILVLIFIFMPKKAANNVLRQNAPAIQELPGPPPTPK